LRCIDFDDVEPGIGHSAGHVLVDCPFFRVERHSNSVISLPESEPAIVTVVSGTVQVEINGHRFQEGDFFLMPAAWAGPKRVIATEGEATLMVTTWPKSA
ncbi:MAG: mannose-6-phosphate isomerase, partial [Verrucomicrobiae bacterium]|nr:mannose-6-phosphate isomerase [Verrucomicrobiae bacterium]